jgi:hypothetical protein
MTMTKSQVIIIRSNLSKKVQFCTLQTWATIPMSMNSWLSWSHKVSTQREQSFSMTKALENQEVQVLYKWTQCLKLKMQSTHCKNSLSKVENWLLTWLQTRNTDLKAFENVI